MSDYLAIKETAELLRVKPDTIRERIRLGIFQQGIHFFKRKGMKPLFKRDAVVAWLEGRDQQRESTHGHKSGAIPMRRGYDLGAV